VFSVKISNALPLAALDLALSGIGSASLALIVSNPKLGVVHFHRGNFFLESMQSFSSASLYRLCLRFASHSRPPTHRLFSLGFLQVFRFCPRSGYLPFFVERLLSCPDERSAGAFSHVRILLLTACLSLPPRLISPFLFFAKAIRPPLGATWPLHVLTSNLFPQRFPKFVRCSVVAFFPRRPGSCSSIGRLASLSR